MRDWVVYQNKTSKKRLKLSTEIAAVIVIKLMILYALWWFFIAPNKVEVDANKMFERVESTESAKSIKE